MGCGTSKKDAAAAPVQQPPVQHGQPYNGGHAAQPAYSPTASPTPVAPPGAPQPQPPSQYPAAPLQQPAQLPPGEVWRVLQVPEIFGLPSNQIVHVTGFTEGMPGVEAACAQAMQRLSPTSGFTILTWGGDYLNSSGFTALIPKFLEGAAGRKVIAFRLKYGDGQHADFKASWNAVAQRFPGAFQICEIDAGVHFDQFSATTDTQPGGIAGDLGKGTQYFCLGRTALKIPNTKRIIALGGGAIVSRELLCSLRDGGRWTVFALHRGRKENAESLMDKSAQQSEVELIRNFAGEEWAFCGPVPHATGALPSWCQRRPGHGAQAAAPAAANNGAAPAANYGSVGASPAAPQSSYAAAAPAAQGAYVPPVQGATASAQPAQAAQGPAPVQPPHIPPADDGRRTFANSEFKRLYDAQGPVTFQDQLFGALRGILSSYATMTGAPQDHAESQFRDLQQQAFNGPMWESLLGRADQEFAKFAVVIWTSSEVAGLGVPFCNILNHVLRSGSGEALQNAVVFCKAMNTHLVTKTRGQHNTSVQWPPECISHRATSMPRAAIDFFQVGKLYRAPMFLATSFSEETCFEFLQRNTDPARLHVHFKFCIDRIKKCDHALYIGGTLGKVGEEEMLYVPYSAFKVRSVTFPEGAVTWDEPVVIELEVQPNNQKADEHCPLAEWH